MLCCVVLCCVVLCCVVLCCVVLCCVVLCCVVLCCVVLCCVVLCCVVVSTGTLVVEVSNASARATSDYRASGVTSGPVPCNPFCPCHLCHAQFLQQLVGVHLVDLWCEGHNAITQIKQQQGVMKATKKKCRTATHGGIFDTLRLCLCVFLYCCRSEGWGVKPKRLYCTKKHIYD